MNIKEIGHGVVGIAKAGLKIDVPPQDVMDRRLDICNKCDDMYRQYVPGTDKHFKKCGKCKCYIQAKIRIYSEKCPLNKW